MSQRQTFMYKLYRSKRSKRLHRQINVGGAIHNHCIALHKRYYRRYKKSSVAVYAESPHGQAETLAQVCLVDAAWLASHPRDCRTHRQGLSALLPNLKDRKAGKTTRRVGPPTFRKIRKAKSFTLTQAGWKLLGGNRLRIGTTVYKFAKSREHPGHHQNGDHQARYAGRAVRVFLLYR